jgi:Mn-dependent DtxR family transcriptional regulator
MEMYLKAVYLISRDNGAPAKTGEISSELGVAPPSVTEMLDRLDDLDLLTHEKYRGAELTELGRKVAENILRKHCILERFLLEVLDVEKSFHEQACRLEHALDDETAMRLTRLVDLPQECPDCYDVEKHHCSKLPI